MSAGQGDYYLNLAREDYYLQNGGEPPGVWLGEGAEILGLSGEVDNVDFRFLFSGFSPDGDRKLVRNAGQESRQAGWDLTFSAPKSVSVAWSQASPEMRRGIQAAHFEAVKSTAAYLEQAAGFSRIGQRGARTPAALTFAYFEHGTSRALDPQLHGHLICFNVGMHAAGTNAVVSSELFRNKMAAGALYRAELSARLEELGLFSERSESWFEIPGVPQELIEEFSTRRRQVLDQLDAYGSSSARAAKIAALDTREPKECLPRAELFSLWSEVGERFGFSQAELEKLIRHSLPARDSELEKSRAISEALTRVTETQSHFATRELVRFAAEEAQGRGLHVGDVVSAAESFLAQSPEIVRLDQVRGETHFTTREMLELERSMMETVASGLGTKRGVSEEALDRAASLDPELTPEQRLAVHHITHGRDSVECVYGMAGTGKSRLLANAREAWEHDGYRVLGAAIAGIAAEGLQASSGISSRTLHSTLRFIETGSLELDGKTVLVVDEAGMVGTRQMEELVRRTGSAGAKLVLVGDWKQLQAIPAGSPFRAIAEASGAVTLTEIRRQDEEWMREAVRLFSSGRAGEALALFAERDMLRISPDRAGATEALLSDWERDGRDRPEENLILVGTRAEAAELNRQAQAARLDALGEESVAIEGDSLFEGDRVLFTRNNAVLGVSNGSLGTVTSIDRARNQFSAVLDDGGELVSIPLDSYADVKLGYAVTTHKSQGMTVQNTFILAGGSMQDRELSYVQASRARGETRLYTDAVEAGEDLADLTRQMEQSRAKDLAIDHLLGAAGVRQQADKQPAQEH